MALIVPKRLELNIHYFICELTPILTTTSMINNNIDGAERYNSVFFVQFFFRFLEPWQWLATWSRGGMLWTQPNKRSQKTASKYELRAFLPLGISGQYKKQTEPFSFKKNCLAFVTGVGVFFLSLTRAHSTRQITDVKRWNIRASEKTTWNGGGTS